MLNIKFSAVILFALTLFLFGCGRTTEKQKDQLGEIEFTVTGDEPAQANFKKGLLLLHSFEFDDAAEQFRKAIEIDKDFTMAYWGEAMTYNHPLWRYQNYEKATAVLNKLAATTEARVAKAKSPIEKDFIKSINILYGTGTKPERDSSYADWLGKLHQKYPGNNEVTSFYSLALLGSVQVGRNSAVYEKAAAMAKEVLKTNSQHPGALHYLIHAYDDPAHAGLAVSTADAYSQVAPAAGHALHMPTHIYLALGTWDKVISSNIVSWQAGYKRKERKKLDNDALNYHAYHWLMYGYLQSGQKGKAKAILDSMQLFCSQLNSERAREHLIYQKATYLAETNDYKSSVANIEVKQDDLNISTRAMDYFVTGMKYYYLQNEKELLQVITNLNRSILLDEERISSVGASLCGAIKSPLPNSLDIQQAQVILLELKAMASWLQKDITLTTKYFNQAVTLESDISYAYGPPPIVKPSPEMYAEWLLEINKPSEAIIQFNHSLQATPGRLLSLIGKEKATEMMLAVKL